MKNVKRGTKLEKEGKDRNRGKNRGKRKEREKKGKS